MGSPSPAAPARLLLAVCSRYPQALSWARDQAEQCWGSVALASPVFDFTETDYYAHSMGSHLKKTFWLFAGAFDQADLARIKLQTNAWEAAYATLHQSAEVRPLNLDPGYLTSAKLVLASTKDHSHRLYLQQGIYAEVTLYFKHKGWHAREWTYPDYRRADFQEFFTLARQHVRPPAGEGPK